MWKSEKRRAILIDRGKGILEKKEDGEEVEDHMKKAYAASIIFPLRGERLD